MPKEMVSIVIPVYQSAGQLKRAVLSVLAQTYRPIEVILIDDGSTDKSGMICEKFAKKYKEVSVWHREHQGVSAARNYGILKAKGKYIQFVDADDEVLPHMTECLVLALQKSNAYMAVCGYETVYQESIRRKSFSEIAYGGKGFSTEKLYEIVKHDLLSVTWNKLYIRERIRQFYDEELLLCEDSVFCAGYFMNNPKLAVCPKVLYRYHVSDGDVRLRGERISGYNGIKKYYEYNQRLVKGILDDTERKKAGQHIDRVFFYGVYTYIFEALPCSGLKRREKIAVLETIMRDAVYKTVISHLKNLHFKEKLYKAASSMSDGQFLFLMICCRRCLMGRGK